MLTFLFLMTMAFGQESIEVIPPGSTVTRPDKTVINIQLKSWLLPDSYYKEAVAKATEMEICKPELDLQTKQVVELAGKVREVSKVCLTQFQEDGGRVKELTDRVVSLEARALTAEGRLKEVRTQRNVAWAITGGIILGAATAVAITFGVP